MRVSTALCFVLCAIFSMCSAAAESALVPKAKVLESAHHFGSVPQGARVVHEFDIANEGATDLTIQSITVSCGCTQTAMSSKVIAPGKTEKLRMEFNTAGFSGGKTKTAELKTNDPQNSELVFTLKGTVVPGVELEPARLEFGELRVSDEPGNWRKTFLIKVRDGSEAQIATVRSFSKFLAVSAVGQSSAGSSYSVELSPNTPRGEFRDRIVIEFVDDAIEPVNLPITASVRGDLSLDPAIVSFGVLKSGEILERRVKVSSRTLVPISFKLAPIAHAGVFASLIDVQPGKQAIVVVQVDPSRVEGDLKTSLEIETTHPVESKVVLGIIGVAAPQ